MLNQKINNKDHFIPTSVADHIIKDTDINANVGIEEEQSELYYKTINGKGKIYFKNGSLYVGPVRYGILDGKDCKFVFSNGVEYHGDISKNQLNGNGEYTFSTGSK